MNKNTKIIILAVVAMIASIIAWHSLSTVFHLNLPAGSFPITKVLVGLIYPVMAFCTFLALVSLCLVLINRTLILLGLFILISWPVFLFFPFSPWLLVILLLQIVVFLYYSHRVHSEMKTFIKFSLSKTLRWGLGLVVTAVILSISLTYYIVTTTEQRDTGKEAIDSLVESSTVMANHILPNQIKGYDPDMTLDDFIFQISSGAIENISGELNKQVQQSFGNPLEENTEALVAELRRKVESGEIDQAMLPPEIRENLYSETLTTKDLVSSDIIQGIFQEQINSARDQLLKNLDIEASGSDKMSEVLSKIIRKYAFQFIGPYEKFINPLMAISLFFALTVFNFVFQALIKLIALIIFKLLRATNFVQIEQEKRNADIVTLE